MKINTILKKVRMPFVLNNHPVKKISLDSKTCTRNTVFFAIKGNKEDGSKYIEEAIQNGAQTIVSETEFKNKKYSINYILVENARKTLAEMAKYFYHDVSKKLKLIGITGTNGKTTTSILGYNFFNSIGKKSMVIGTSGVFWENFTEPTTNTTPDILSLYHYLLLAKKKKISYVFMEISSVAVDQYRIYGLKFDSLIFTNFSQDHLDYHKTLDRYLYCKVIPFIKLSSNAYAILNIDDEAYPSFAKYTDAKIITYGIKKNADILGTIYSSKESGVSFYMKDILFKTKLLGKFNIMNCLSILALCKVYHISYIKFHEFISLFEPVLGRMNVIPFEDKKIWIDYAHTFSATKLVIEEARFLCKGQLHIVLGCGGNREKEKRFQIGELLNTIDADIILTTDNPRFEDPLAIISDIQSKITKKIDVIPNRKEAIDKALSRLSKKDYLLILGKGCEPYMDVKGIKYPYSDTEVIYEWIRAH